MRATGRAGDWIDSDVSDAYGALHDLGWAHSIEAWDDEGLAGGLYGVSIGGLFAAESMFHAWTDASKAAFVGLVELRRRTRRPPTADLDVQWLTPHRGRWARSRSRAPSTDGALEAALELGADRQESRPMSFVRPMKNSSRTIPRPITETRS